MLARIGLDWDVRGHEGIWILLWHLARDNLSPGAILEVPHSGDCRTFEFRSTQELGEFPTIQQAIARTDFSQYCAIATLLPVLRVSLVPRWSLALRGEAAIAAWRGTKHPPANLEALGSSGLQSLPKSF